jgi:DNA-binding transcriptional LysR family regulator
LPPALAAYQRAFPQVNVLLHDASWREIVDGLQDGTLDLAVMPEIMSLQAEGIEFEPLRAYPFCVALPPKHRLARLKAVPLEKIAAEPIVGFSRRDYPDYYPFVERLFLPLSLKPRIAVECDSASSLITAVETGRGIALAMSVFKTAIGKRLTLRPVAGSREVIPVGIARAKSGDVTPTGEKFCEILRKISKETGRAGLF